MKQHHLSTIAYCKACTSVPGDTPVLFGDCHITNHTERELSYECPECWEECGTPEAAYGHCMLESHRTYREFVRFLSPPHGWLQHRHCPKCGQCYGLEVNNDLYRCYDCKSLISEDAIITDMYRRKIDPLQVRDEYLHFKRKQESINHTFVL